MTNARDCTSLICIQCSYRPNGCCTNVNEIAMDIRKWFKNTTSNKPDNGNDGETETRPRREVSLAAGEQAAASSCSLSPKPLPSPPAPEQASGSTKARPPNDLGKEEP
ncbi:hypothetical protein ABVT39_011352 [Epinephelus coioides]